MPEPSSPRPTYREIARRADCSLSTVSYALRNSPRISEETREKVAKIAHELGYTSNPLVSALMNQVRKNQRVAYRGLIVGFCQGHENDPRQPVFAPGFYEGAQEAAHNAGYDLELFSLDDPDVSPDRLGRIIRARGIPAGLVAPLGRERDSLPPEFFHNIAGATIGTYLRQPSLHRAAADQYGAAWDAMEQLHRLGYRKAALVVHAGTHYGGRRQFAAGFHWWHMEHQNSRPETLLLPALEEEHRPLFLNWVRETAPDVVVSGSEGSLLLQWLQEGGWQVPGDLGFISLTILNESSPMAGMRVHSERIGAAAVDLLLGQINRNECGIPDAPKLVLIKNTWQDGPTVHAPSR